MDKRYDKEVRSKSAIKKCHREANELSASAKLSDSAKVGKILDGVGGMQLANVNNRMKGTPGCRETNGGGIEKIKIHLTMGIFYLSVYFLFP